MLTSIEQVVVTEPVPDGALVALYSRYCLPVDDHDPRERVTLLLHHCLGLHKETWEPTISHISRIQSETDVSTVVSEVWSVEAPNHGHSSVYNEGHFLRPPLSAGLPPRLSAANIQSFLQSGRIATNKVIAVGHSAGGAAIVLSTMGYSLSKLPFSSIILIEPPWMTRDILAKISRYPKQLKRAIESTRTRTDIWQSREACREWMAHREPYKKWHPRVLDLFVTHALRQLPTANYPDIREGVTLACTKEQEASLYTAPPEAHLGPLKRLSELCPIIPVHCIFANTETDLLSEEIRRGICDEKENRVMASTTTIQGAGHLVVQEKPDEVAIAIMKTLQLNTPGGTKARL